MKRCMMLGMGRARGRKLKERGHENKHDEELGMTNNLRNEEKY